MGNFDQKVNKFIEIFWEQNGYNKVLQGLQNTLMIAIAGLIIGIIMIFSPAMSFLTLRVGTYIVAAYFVLFGIENIISAFARRNYDW